MAVVRPLEEDELDPALREGVQFFEVPLGVIPSSVRTMVHRPEIARASINLNIAVTTGYGAVTPEFKRLIRYVHLSPRAACIARRT